MSSHHSSAYGSKSNNSKPTPSAHPSRFGKHLEVPGQSSRPASTGSPDTPSGYKQSGAHIPSVRASQPVSAANVQAPSAQRTNTAPRASHHSEAPRSYHSEIPRSYHSHPHHSETPAQHGQSQALVPSRPLGGLIPHRGGRAVGMKWKMDTQPLAPLRKGEKRRYMEVVTTTARMVEERRK